MVINNASVMEDAMSNGKPYYLVMYPAYMGMGTASYEAYATQEEAKDAVDSANPNGATPRIYVCNAE